MERIREEGDGGRRKEKSDENEAHKLRGGRLFPATTFLTINLHQRGPISDNCWDNFVLESEHQLAVVLADANIEATSRYLQLHYYSRPQV
jgi:hypothetical protein